MHRAVTLYYKVHSSGLKHHELVMLASLNELLWKQEERDVKVILNLSIRNGMA
jgi:hypothetical protein